MQKLCGGVGVTSSGVVVLRRAFISLLAYTYWLDLSRDKLSFADPEALMPTYKKFLRNRRLPKAGVCANRRISV